VEFRVRSIGIGAGRSYGTDSESALTVDLFGFLIGQGRWKVGTQVASVLHNLEIRDEEDDRVTVPSRTMHDLFPLCATFALGRDLWIAPDEGSDVFFLAVAAYLYARGNAWLARGHPGNAQYVEGGITFALHSGRGRMSMLTVDLNLGYRLAHRGTAVEDGVTHEANTEHQFLTTISLGFFDFHSWIWSEVQRRRDAEKLAY